MRLRKARLLITFLIGFQFLTAQKRAIHLNDLGNWPFLINARISDDGKYVMHGIRNMPAGSSRLVIKSTENAWEMSIAGVETGTFANNSRMAIFKATGDRLGLSHLGTSRLDYIDNVSQFAVSPSLGFVGYLLKGSEKTLVILNLRNGTQKVFKDVSSYSFGHIGSVGIVQNINGNRQYENSQRLLVVDLEDTLVRTIAIGNKISSFVFDNTDGRLAYTILKGQVSSLTTTLLCNILPARQSLPLINDNLLLPGRRIEKVLTFSKDGERVFFSIKYDSQNVANVDSQLSSINVWNYNDYKLQSQQLKAEERSEGCAGVVDVKMRKMVELEHPGERSSIRLSSYTNEDIDEYVLVYGESDSDENEKNWNIAYSKRVFLVSTRTGQRRELTNISKAIGMASVYLSPSREYVLYFDPEARDYFSYSIKNGTLKNITDGICTKWTPDGDWPSSRCINIGVAGWMKDGEHVLLYDRRDIWMVDLAGKQTPVNITNHFGVDNNIVFRFAIKEYSSRPLAFDEKLLLSAYNLNTKDNGFYEKKVSNGGDPSLLTMGAYIYSIVFDRSSFGSNFPVQKAKHALLFLVRRESTAESSNVFITKDFKKFKKVSQCNPQRNVSWYSSELHQWKSGSTFFEGVLYKPEDFDSSKKYPVIVHCYEGYTDQLNRHHIPNLTGDHINIPWFVANGYLVFTPDIRYKIGSPNESALRYINEAFTHLAAKSYVDPKRIGLQGHSWGGIQTEYILTHSNAFAAAVVGSALSNMISGYGGIQFEGNGSDLKPIYELGQSRMGSTLWENIDGYINNSGIFNLRSVTTPVLMMNNKLDAIIPFSQGVEFFSGLRRSNHPAWLLQYDGKAHGVSGDAARDYTIRTTEFFDHHLKGSLPPTWMIKCGSAKSNRFIRTAIR